MFSKLRTLIFLFVLTVLVITSGCDALTSSGKEEPTPTPIPPPPVPEKPTYTVKRGLVVDSLSFTGRVAPVIEEELFFRESGRMKKVYVERKEIVEEGTLLAELENDDLLRQLAQAEIELETVELNLEAALAVRQYRIDTAEIGLAIKKLQIDKLGGTVESLALDEEIAEANLAKGKVGPTEEDLAIARHQLEQAKNSLWSAQVGRDSTCGQSRGADCDKGQAAVQRAEEGVRISELSLKKLQRPPDPEAIAILEANYKKVLLNREQTQIDLDIQRQQIALAELDLGALNKEVDPQLVKGVERSKLSVERLRAQVENTRVVSPIMGKVTSVSAYEGREVSAYKTVFVVSDETDLEVTAEPMSSQLARLAEEMAASIILSAYPGKELPGEILALPYPYGSGGGATVEEADKLTHVSFDPQDLDIEPGDLVKVIVTLEKKENALWLPPAAIRTFAGRQFVVVQEAGRQRRADITVGIESSERLEIEDGLEEGQVVMGQ